MTHDRKSTPIYAAISGTSQQRTNSFQIARLKEVNITQLKKSWRTDFLRFSSQTLHFTSNPVQEGGGEKSQIPPQGFAVVKVRATALACSQIHCSSKYSAKRSILCQVHCLFDSFPVLIYITVPVFVALLIVSFRN